MLCTWGWIWDFISPAGQFMRVGRLKAFLFGTIGVASLKIGKAWSPPLGLFYAYICIIFVQQGMPATSTMEIFLITTTFFLIPELVKHVRLHTFENIILITASAHGCIGLLNSIGIYPFLPLNNPAYIHEAHPIIGLLGQQTLLAPFLAFALGISLHRFAEAKYATDKLIYKVLSLFYFIVILLAGSVMGYVSLAAVLWIYLLFYQGEVIAFSVAAVVWLVAAWFALRHGDRLISEAHGRIEPWTDAIRLIKMHPWLGYGVGTWSVAAEKLAQVHGYKAPWSQLHNEYLQGQFEFGVIGMLILGVQALILTARIHFLYLFRSRRLVPYVAGLAALMANALGNFPLHVAPHGMLLAFCVYVILKGED